MKQNKRTLYRVQFMGHNKLYEVYVQDVYQANLYGFVVLEGLLFGEHTTLVVDPAEEKLKNEFAGVTQTSIPMHAIIRVDEVEKEGTGKITDLGDNVTHFPSPVYTPRGSDRK